MFFDLPFWICPKIQNYSCRLALKKRYRSIESSTGDGLRDFRTENRLRVTNLRID
jgi:hypothetical protein